MSVIVPILAGVFAGCLSGLGLGGGTILIPALVFAMGLSQREAQVYNLLYFVPTAVAALVTHIKKRSIEFSLLPGLVTLGIIGAIIGATIALKVDESLLRKMFGAFLLVLGLTEIFKKR